MASIHTKRRPSSIQSNHRKTAHALRENASAFVERHGLHRCGFLSLTFKDKMWPIPAARCFKKAVRSFHDYCVDWIWVMGLGKSFRIHYHALLALELDIRTGIDLSAYPKLLTLEDGYDPFGLWCAKGTIPIQQCRKELRAALSRNTALQGLRTEMYPRLRDAGFGQQINLSPIFTDGPTIAKYLRTNYLEVVLGRSASFRRQRLVGYKQGSERCYRSSFAWVGHREWRDACQRIAQALGVDDYSGMCPTFGPKWGHRIGFLMEALRSLYGDSPERWPAVAIILLSSNTMPKVTENPLPIEDDDDLAVAA